MIKTFTIDTDKWRLVPIELIEAFPEINLNNYGEDEVRAVNEWGIGVVTAAAPQPEPVDVDPVIMLPFAILDDELADLRRFTDCADDGEGYDVPKNRMKRLAEIGLLRHVSSGYYEHTVFGLSVLNGDFTTPQPDRTAELEAALKVARDALIPYMKLVDGTKVKNQAAQAYDKINEVLKHD